MLERRTQCFLSLPDSVIGSDLHQHILGLLRRNDIEPVQLEPPTDNGASLTLFDVIERANFAIADITDSDARVMYEVGIAHGVRTPVIFVLSDEATVPLGLHIYPFVFYNPANLEIFTAALQKEVEWVHQRLRRVYA